MNDPQEQRQLLIDHWENIAAYAWQGYQAKGRGALAILSSKISNIPVMSQGDKTLMRTDVPMWYIPYKPDQEPFNIPKIDVVKDYNPRKVVVVFIITEGYPMVYDTHYIETPKGQPTPPQAYKKQKKARKN